MQEPHTAPDQSRAVVDQEAGPAYRNEVPAVTLALPLPALVLLWELMWAPGGLVDQMDAGARPWTGFSGPLADETIYRWAVEALSKAVPAGDTRDRFDGNILISHRIPDIPSYVGPATEAHRELPIGVYPGVTTWGAYGVHVAVGEKFSHAWPSGE